MLHAALHTVSFVHGKMHSDWFNRIVMLQGRWQHGEKVGYCYPSGLEKDFFLGCSYLASSVRIAIRLPTDATVYFVKNLFPLFLPYMFRPLISPSSGVSQAVFYMQPFGLCSVYVAHMGVPVDWFVVMVSRQTQMSNINTA